MPTGRTAFATLPSAPLQADGFEGPFELLLHLLDAGRLEITAVSLARVTEQYLAYLRSWSASQRHLKATGRDAVGEAADAMAQAWGDPETPRQVTWPLSLRVGRRGD